MTNDIFQALGLDRNPFSMAADTDGYFHTEATKQILDELAFGILSRKGFLLLTGEVGVGKTSLLYQLLRRLDGEELATAWIFNTMLNKEELLLAIARDFGIDAPRTANVAGLVDLLQTFLVERNSEGRNCAIIVDEAHNLSLPAMEALRMLSNLELEGRKLVQILLVGQPELKARLDEPKLRQLRSRITIYKELLPFNREETGRFVNFKLSSASSPFRLSGAPLKILHMATCGNTRMINLVMERALYASVAFGEKELSARALRAAVAEIGTCQVEVAERMGAARRRVNLALTGVAAAVAVALAFAPLMPSGSGQTSVARMAMTSVLSMQLLDEKENDAGKLDADSAFVNVDGRSEGTVSADEQHGVDIENVKMRVANSENASSMAIQVAAVEENRNLTADTKTATSLDTGVESVRSDAYPEEYGKFLGAAGLEKHLADLDRAVREGKIDILEEVLPEPWQVLELDRLPAQTGMTFASFPWKKIVRDDPAWLVLWEPPFVVQDFYYGYRNEDILKLQKMLKVLGYYWGPDDGMVGPVTWRAINGFQKDMKLKRTMWPDPETVFWLIVMSKQG
ncbi:type II secretory pathway predicted ATPase ExeA [Desulfobaculum xiamenense]|uniref:Type II secretory pathway predicted ATPase ExeA n=1 Tax=Desulfobaculum xiamenense TaxID=995050 RepID=A0A846QGD5_9BACT|nr:ExeA family protein [Desulfobaculum xiamenense]NJB67866.1 type II secretory pathway predicted ATPase ExeA [Desulfobaculum xiamenense]